MANGRDWTYKDRQWLQKNAHMGLEFCANRLGRSLPAVKQMASRLRARTFPELEYNNGRLASQKGMQITSCPNMSTIASAWWKAGWHDADVEAGNSWL